MSKPTRRTFIATGIAAGLPILPSVAMAASASERLRIGVIGIGVRGKFLIANMPEEARVVALCDCSTINLQSAFQPAPPFAETMRTFVERDATQCRTYQDYRVMLLQEELDAVVIAAPDHHHALATILACQSGMHVYVEKPLAVTISEGQAMVAAAKKYDRIVQVGSQQRTMQVNRFACEWLRDGGLGDIESVQLQNFPGPMPYQPLDAQTVPEGLEWNLFCGPTPLRPYHRDLWMKDAYKVGDLMWRGWDLFRDYSGHLMTNWGAHSVDMVQYALGMDDSGPTEIQLHPDQIDKTIDDKWHVKTPPLGAVRDSERDRMRFCPLSMSYPNGTLLHFDPTVDRAVFHGTKGKLFLSRNNYTTEPGGLLPPPDKIEQKKWRGDGHVARPHLQNWINTILGRETLNAPIEVGHRTATVCHLANLARELGRSVRWDAKTETLLYDREAFALQSRPRRTGFELPVGE